MSKTKKRILLSAIIVLLFLGIDGVKSYAVARHYVSTKYPTATNIRFQQIYFIGVWRVGFKMDAWHEGAWMQVTVAPVLPMTIGYTICK